MEKITKSSLKEGITDNLGDTINILLNDLLIDKELFNDLILLKGRFELNEKQYTIQDVLSIDEYRRERNKISVGIINIIDLLNIEDGIKKINQLEEELKIYKNEAEYLSFILEGKNSTIKNLISNMNVTEDSWIKGIRVLLLGTRAYFQPYDTCHVNDINLLEATLIERFRENKELDLETRKCMDNDASKNNILKIIEYFLNRDNGEYLTIIYFSGTSFEKYLICFDSENPSNSKYESLLNIEELSKLHTNSKSKVLYIIDSNTNPKHIEFNVFDEFSVGFLFASDSKSKVYENRFREGRFSVLTYAISKCFREYQDAIPVMFLPEFLNEYLNSFGKIENTNSKPFFWCSESFNMTIPKYSDGETKSR